LFQGIGFLKNTGNEWKIQLVDASKTFFDDISKDLKELDFESHDFTYGATAYNTLKNLSSSVWVWPIVKMHETVSETDLTYLRPHFSFWTLLSAIFTTRGKALTMDTNLIQNLAIQANSEDFKFTSFQKTLNGSTVGTLLTNDFNFGTTLGVATIDVGLLNKTSFRLRGNITSVAGGSLKFNDDEIEIRPGTNYYDEETSELTGLVTVALTGDASFDNTLLYTLISENSFDNIGSFAPSGYRVKVYDNMPLISQKDLFTDALTLTNSIIIPDNFNGTINLVSLNGLNSENKVDWSAKYIEDSETISSEVDKLSQRNNLTYDNNVGNAFFDTALAFIKKENDYIKLRYSGSPDRANFAVYNVYHVDADTNNVRNDRDYLRLVHITGIYGRFTPINWANLTTGYYSGMFDSLYKPRVIHAKFNLSKLDVIGFEPLKLVYLKQYNANFIVQSIEQYIPNELTTVKLLRYGR